MIDDDTPANQGSEETTAFSLGHVDASLSFLALLSDDLRDVATQMLALKWLSRLWQQYKEDCSLNHGRTLVSLDNSFEIRLFLRLVGDFADWSPLRDAIRLLASATPALSPYEVEQFETTYPHAHDLCNDIVGQLSRLEPNRSPSARIAGMITRLESVEASSEISICWALNLVLALRPGAVGLSRLCTPFPSLLRRELFRFDRSPAWRAQALLSTITASAHMVSDDVFGGIWALRAFERGFPALRRHSRLRIALVLLVGLGEVTPSILGKLLGCTEPGARKLLGLLAGAGLGVRIAPSPAFSASTTFRLAEPGLKWMRSLGSAFELSHETGSG